MISCTSDGGSIAEKCEMLELSSQKMSCVMSLGKRTCFHFHESYHDMAIGHQSMTPLQPVAKHSQHLG